MNKKTIVVFGATGTLGLHFVDHLYRVLDQGEWQIMATGRRPVKYFDSHYAGDVSYRQVEIADRDSFGGLPERDVYAVVHFAGALPAYMEG